MRTRPRLLQVVLGGTLLSLAAIPEASATDRHLTYTYESGVLHPGEVELEPWTTFRFGRDLYYSRFDQRLELELGVTHRLQTSIYLNFTGLAQDVAVGETVERESELEFGGISSEWKLKLSDPVANALGSALYLELTASPTELELEGKIIVDKRAGNLLLAGNLVFEQEWELESADETEKETKAEIDLGAAYFITPHLTLGLELRNNNVIEDGELEHSGLFLGPTLGYVHKGYWIAVSVLPQLPFMGHDGEATDLHEYEKVNARLLLGVHL